MIQTQSKFSILLSVLATSFLFIASGSFAQADSIDVMKTPAHDAMKKLAWLEGTWEGQGEVPGAGKYTSTMTYALDLNGHIIRHEYQAVQNGNVVWRDQGMLAYNDDLKKVIAITIGIDGTFGQGEGVIAENDSMYTITGNTSGATPFKSWRTIVTRVDDSTARTRFEFKKGDAYEFFSEETMKKKK